MWSQDTENYKSQLFATTELAQKNKTVTKNHSHRSLYWDDKVRCPVFQEIDHLGRANVSCTDNIVLYVLTSI